MQTGSFKSTVEGLVLDTAWSLWAEVGVSGWTRRHHGVAIDLEPLILATPYLGRLDVRLLQESLDWCVTNARLVSAVRLRNLLPTFGPAVARAYGDFSATVKKHKTVSWPGDGKALRLSPTGRSSMPDLGRASLVQLRLRAMFGVSARAEIIRRMLPEPDRPFGVSELAMYTAYGKDNLADALDLLAMAGIVARNVMTTAGNVHVFRLTAAEQLTALLVELPDSDAHPYWAARFRVMLQLIDFVGSEPADGAVRATEIQRLVGDLQSDLRWVASYPRMRRGIDEVNDDFDDWATGLLRDWSKTSEKPQTRVATGSRRH
jgi:hypothetical protein